MDHIDRIQRAIDFIETHLTESISIESIAHEACFSMWHFQKIFSSTVGDSVKEYVRKRRLTSAVNDLSKTNRRIIEIALDYQFDSQESFTRAFKTFTGVTPGELRKNGLGPTLHLNKPKITFEYLDHLYGGMTMSPQFVFLEEKCIIGIDTNFISILSPDKNNDVLIPKLWDVYMERSHEIKNRNGPIDMGVCEPVTNRSLKQHPAECYYLAGTEVPSNSDIPEGMTLKKVPAGRYAVFTHKGKLEKLQHTMNYIYGSWLPKSGEQLRDAPDLEIYDHRFKFGAEDSELDIYIPVK